MRRQILDEMRFLRLSLANTLEFRDEGPIYLFFQCLLPNREIPNNVTGTEFLLVADHEAEVEEVHRRHELGLPIEDKRYLSEKGNGPPYLSHTLFS